MPCFDGTDGRINESYLNTEIERHARTSAMLCGLMTALSGMSPDVRERIREDFNEKEAGVSFKELISWWKQHKEQDKQRKREEREAKRRKKKERLRRERERAQEQQLAASKLAAKKKLKRVLTDEEYRLLFGED